MIRTRPASRTLALLTAALLLASCAGGGSKSEVTPGCDPGSEHQLEGGLATTDVRCGTGPALDTGAVVHVSYVGKLAGGRIFDDTGHHRRRSFPIRLGAQDVIPGLDLGIVGMGVGGVRRITVPPSLAFGAPGYPDKVPADATLTFLVTVVGAGG